MRRTRHDVAGFEGGESQMEKNMGSSWGREQPPFDSQKRTEALDTNDEELDSSSSVMSLEVDPVPEILVKSPANNLIFALWYPDHRPSHVHPDSHIQDCDLINGCCSTKFVINYH